ncbi:MAG TPA: ATP-binding cassette domain-containing protein [Candidatus Tumulicola sp.]|nr:ATP-binding cassette domain-containing protein [Candidatus Tumulicola sp.]
MSALDSRPPVISPVVTDRAIEVRGVTFSFTREGPPTLIDIDMDVNPGEIVILTGPSGAGKTTLMTLVGALRTIQSGSIRVFHEELAGLSARGQREIRKRIGFIFQDHNLFDALTTFDTLNLAMKLCDPIPPRAEILRRARTLLTSLGIGDYLHSRPHEMSTGQKQRVAIARALIHRPRIILADEPTASLDRDTTNAVLSVLRRRANEDGVTILMVTHDTLLFDQVDRVVTMAEGRILSNR